MLVRAALLTSASLVAVAGFAGHIPPGWGAILWVAAASVDLVRAFQERRRARTEALLHSHEMEAARAFAEDAYHGFQQICEATPVFVWTGDPDGEIEYVNKAFREFLGVTSHTVDWKATVHPDDLCIGLQYLSDLQAGIEPPPMFCRIKRADGKWRWLYSVSRAQGTPVRRLIGIGIDATAWKDVEQAHGELLEAKQNFLAVMSHELRTPLTAILGYTALMKEGLPEPLPPADLEVMDRVEEAANKLLALVDEVLLFNSLDNAQERVALDKVDPVECVHSVQQLLQPRARQLGLSIAVDTTYAPKLLTTDSTKLRRALINLINNALKFTKQGTITVRVVEDDKYVRFAVIDPGVGIDTAKQRHMFEPFWQERQSMVREAGGMGLGLAVCHRIASLLGGNIEVESQPGYGSTFTLVLPK